MKEMEVSWNMEAYWNVENSKKHGLLNMYIPPPSSGAPSTELVNFAKRWQQFNILDNMRRFKQSHYDQVNKNEKILSFFNSFQEYLDEEELWQISETIKPRGGRKL